MYSLTMQDFDVMEKRCMGGDTLATIGELAKIDAFIAATASASFARWTVRKSLIERRKAGDLNPKIQITSSNQRFRNITLPALKLYPVRSDTF